MTTRSWLRNLFASRTPRTPRKAPARFRPCLDNLEERLTPTTTIRVGPTTPDLITAINTADRTPGPVVLVLPASTTYTLTQPDNPTTNASAGREDQNWYGPNGLPAIDNDITIQGNGSTITRTGSAARISASRRRPTSRAVSSTRPLKCWPRNRSRRSSARS